jgi:phage shock protein C
MKKLYRSSTNKVAAGILGGLGEYWDIDPVVLRLAFVFLILITGFFPGVIAYVIALFIVPEKKHENGHEHQHGHADH